MQGFDEASQFHQLDDEHGVFVTDLPVSVREQLADFETLWNLHPEEYSEIFLHGRTVKIPRWQQAYGEDYHFSGKVSHGLPVPTELMPVWNWACETIDSRLNGLLLNWYDARLGHYIGKHRDSTSQMIEHAPIVTVSLGEERTFRMRPYGGKGFHDFAMPDGTVIIIPYATNLAWTHEVPKSTRAKDRRISITLRAFQKNP
ncbi:alpha-ketoglutarate-dependent dioxygenase AlkB [Thalassoroseus pseudoceratinae]|uniref:alpha-ketoglutarate-dependent dioxygenase AlkB n=1 Tax=Thalassoroseus pseudoceratinae TaxID=2713176 RepID=UPI001420611D|nr:alpha-ketoglutarate-dependent dioxygenase AlkB [Thalassoroseus pseudoceratinae]